MKYAQPGNRSCRNLFSKWMRQDYQNLPNTIWQSISLMWQGRCLENKNFIYIVQKMLRTICRLKIGRTKLFFLFKNYQRNFKVEISENFEVEPCFQLWLLRFKWNCGSECFSFSFLNQLPERRSRVQLASYLMALLIVESKVSQC